MVAKLVAIDGPEKGLELILEKGEAWVIGRDPKVCDFILDDPKVSRRHAKIRLEGKKYFLKNFSRTNPSLIEDEAFKGEKELSFDQSVKIGESHFRFTKVKTGKGKSDSDDYDQLFEDLDEPPIDIGQSEETSAGKKDDNDHYDTIFQDIAEDDTYGDLSQGYAGSERFVLKVLAGPNTGAEFSMQKGRSYIIGTDVTGADIIFNDLSVSRHHARVSVTEEDEVVVEDLDSRNGVIVDDHQIKGQKILTPKNMVTLGTTTFLVIDRESGEETIITKLPQVGVEDVAEKEIVEPIEEKVIVKKSPFKGLITESTFIFTGVLIAAILVLGTGAVLLFKTSPVERNHKDYTQNIESVLGSEFSDIRFTFNPGVGSLFLVGHVLTTTDKDELLYKLNNLGYVNQIQDNVVVDEYVSQEMNMIISRNPYWVGISLHSPQPGQFVLSGYLSTRAENAALTDYMNVQFPYVDRLTNYVVVEEDLYQDIVSKLHNYGFYNVKVELTNGDVVLTGYVNNSYEKAFGRAIKDLSRIMGVRKVNDYVVVVGPICDEKDKNKLTQCLETDPSVINLTDYAEALSPVTGTYTITGYAERNSQGTAVEISGKIFTLGDRIDGMKIIAFADSFVFLEKNGLKYKIKYIK